jgi:signal peptidase I
MPSSSMEPTLHCSIPQNGCEAQYGDELLVEDVEPDRIERGDIVVFEAPGLARSRCGAGGTFIKRVVGLPGERIELRSESGSSYVYVDQRKLNEPYIEPGRRDTRGDQSFDVPEGEYFMMGDNRAQSCDSREWGTVPGTKVIGRVVAAERPSGRVDFR